MTETPIYDRLVAERTAPSLRLVRGAEALDRATRHVGHDDRLVGVAVLRAVTSNV